MKSQTYIILLCLSLLFSVSCLSSISRQDNFSEEEEEIVLYPDTLKMVFAGDIMGHMPQIRGAYHDGGIVPITFFLLINTFSLTSNRLIWHLLIWKLPLGTSLTGVIRDSPVRLI